MNLKSLITIDPDILGGTPVFMGTRVPVESLFDHLESGISLDDFLEDFPTVKREQAIAALAECKMPKGFTIDPSLDGKYDDQPVFKGKVDQANHILKTVGLPKDD